MNKTNWRYGNHHINILGISLIALGATLFVPNRVLAQWRVGASGGATFNHYSIDTQYQTDYRYGGAWGWSAAITGQYDFFDWMGLHIELEASERNYRFYRTGVFSGIDYICHNTYLQLPVMARFSFGAIPTTEPELTIRAKVTKQVRNLAYINAEITNSKGELCNEGEAIYFLMNQERAREMGFLHCEVEEE